MEINRIFYTIKTNTQINKKKYFMKLENIG